MCLFIAFFFSLFASAKCNMINLYASTKITSVVDHIQMFETHQFTVKALWGFLTQECFSNVRCSNWPLRNRTSYCEIA